MAAIAGNLGRNGVKRTRLDPLNPSNQQNGSRKSLLERLNSAGEEQSNPTAPVIPEKPRYVDVTAAFFGRERRPMQERKGEMLPPSPRPVKQQQPPHPYRQEIQNHDKQRQPVGHESPIAKELKDELKGAICSPLSLCVPASKQSAPAELTSFC